MQGLLDELRAADALPWDEDKIGYWKLVMPQTTRWLPEEERAEILRVFAAELERLGAA